MPVPVPVPVEKPFTGTGSFTFTGRSRADAAPDAHVFGVTALDRLLRRGFRRVGSPKAGFRYLAPGGRSVPRAQVERIRGLVLPPAWTDVRVSPAAGDRLQAIGRDRAGRWQYRYHRAFQRRRAAAKYRRLLRFADALPRIRAAVQRDVRRRGLPRAGGWRPRTVRE